MIVSYKYRAYPDATTETRLNSALDTCRWLYNKLLEEYNTAREHGFTPTMREMQARIVTLKEENPFLKGVYSKVLQMVNYTLWSNIAALSQTKKRGRKIGKLRFKSASRYRTLNYNQSGFKIDREHSAVTFSKIGTIPFAMHRPYSGVVKGVLITRSGDNWYVIIQAEQDVSEPKKEGRSVGIDVGLDSFAVDRDYNAAVNIHRVGMEQPFEPVEPRPLHHISVVQVLSMKQEAPPFRAG